MLAWTFCILSLLSGLYYLATGLKAYAPGIARERARLRRVTALLQEIEETLAAGLVPASTRWQALAALPEPWGELVSGSVEELRSGGGALLPTLRRLRGLARDHDAALTEARARASQALAQAMVCAGLVPVFGVVLYWLLPGLESRPSQWGTACLGALTLTAAGAWWMLVIAERARWAGLSPEARPWVLASQCAGERFLALVRAGNPADLAWTRASQWLSREAAGLARRWGASVWKADEPGGGPESSLPALRALDEAGSHLRRAVQVGLMEGRPCTERAEAALAALRQELRSAVERELGLLGTRALKPLFVCVAPAVFLLLGFGLWLSWQQASGGAG